MAGDMSSALEHAARHIFKRCVQCPPITPSCPTCPDGQICSLVPQDCETCAHMICIKNPSPAPVSHGPNVGAIAGGVVGGVAFVALVVFLIWRFWIKKRREQQDQELEEEWENDDIAYQKRSQRFTDAGSTRTRGSLANSILSRASNIIQIAYIPGVTNRDASGMNTPVPPIPAAHRQGAGSSPKSPLSNEGDALFFGIGDLRGSTYSGTSSVGSGHRDTRYSNNRDTRYTMASITPSLARDSVASDVYWDNATTAPMPATTVAVSQPRMVSVKSSQNSTTTTPGSESAPGTPPEHPSDKTKEVQVMVPGQGVSPSGSIRGKATQVTLGGGGGSKKGRFPVRQNSDASSSAAAGKHIPNVSSPLAGLDQDLLGDDADEHTRARQSLMANMDFMTPPAVQPVESPFFDASESPSAAAIAAASSTRPNPYASMASTIGRHEEMKRNHRYSVGGLSAVSEETARRASQESSIRAKRDSAEGPFSDTHEVKDERRSLID